MLTAINLPLLFRSQEDPPPPPDLIQQVDQSLAAAEVLYNRAIEFLVAYSFQILGAIIVLVVGFWLAGRMHRFVLGFCQKRNLDVTLSKFIAGALRFIFLLFIGIVVLNQLRIPISPFIAAIGAAAFGLTLAIQGPISNYGAGLALILTRPFKVGDTLTVVERSGIVQDIRLACTILKTEDDEIISIPNRKVVGEVYENTYEFRLVEGVIGIPYSEDPEPVIAALKKTLGEASWVEAAPKLQVGIHRFKDSSVDIGFRCWVSTLAYNEHRYATNLLVFKTLRGMGVKIPFPQREVRILGKASAKDASDRLQQ